MDLKVIYLRNEICTEINEYDVYMYIYGRGLDKEPSYDR